LDKLLDKRVLLVAGKGGVGRTTVTAALARWAAREGRRVLVAEVSEDNGDYSPLGKLFGVERLPRSAAELAPSIFGSQLLANVGFELFLSDVLKMPTLARAALESEALRRLLHAAPSFREMGIFYHLLSYLRAKQSDGSPRHELIILDTPATGHVLALTALPEILLRLLSWGPIPDALREGQSYVNDPTRGAAVVVTLPEQLPVTEALELAEGLVKSRIHLAGTILNAMPESDIVAAERAVLDSLVSGQALFGASGYRRAVGARRAAERLAQAQSSPLYVLPHLGEQGSALVETLAALCPQTSQRERFFSPPEKSTTAAEEANAPRALKGAP
jgi:anion-transporting  ArsA/GET3 family ATPase